MSAGSDAHFANEIGNGRTIFQGVSLEAEEIRRQLLNNEVTKLSLSVIMWEYRYKGDRL